MIRIGTKKMPSGDWSCFATIKGYDYAFVTSSREESQQQMQDHLKESKLSDHALFMEEIEYHPVERKRTYQWEIKWEIRRLDHL